MAKCNFDPQFKEEIKSRLNNFRENVTKWAEDEIKDTKELILELTTAFSAKALVRTLSIKNLKKNLASNKDVFKNIAIDAVFSGGFDSAVSELVSGFADVTGLDWADTILQEFGEPGISGLVSSAILSDQDGIIGWMRKSVDTAVSHVQTITVAGDNIANRVDDIVSALTNLESYGTDWRVALADAFGSSPQKLREIADEVDKSRRDLDQNNMFDSVQWANTINVLIEHTTDISGQPDSDLYNAVVQTCTMQEALVDLQSYLTGMGNNTNALSRIRNNLINSLKDPNEYQTMKLPNRIRVETFSRLSDTLNSLADSISAYNSSPGYTTYYEDLCDTVGRMYAMVSTAESIGNSRPLRDEENQDEKYEVFRETQENLGLNTESPEIDADEISDQTGNLIKAGIQGKVDTLKIINHLDGVKEQIAGSVTKSIEINNVLSDFYNYMEVPEPIQAVSDLLNKYGMDDMFKKLSEADVTGFLDSDILQNSGTGSLISSISRLGFCKLDLSSLQQLDEMIGRMAVTHRNKILSGVNYSDIQKRALLRLKNKLKKIAAFVKFAENLYNQISATNLINVGVDVAAWTTADIINSATVTDEGDTEI